MELTPEFKKDLSNTYMVLCPLEEEEDSFLIKMLTRNHIDGLLKIEVKMIDNQKYYYYDITGKQTLSDIVQIGPISFLQLQKIYERLLKLPEICKEFLIYENGIFMESNFIYMDASWDIIEFCYYPGIKKELQEQIGKITEYLLNKVDYKDERAVLAVYAFYQVSHDKNCTLEKLKEVFESQCGKIAIDKKELNKKECEKIEQSKIQDMKREKNYDQGKEFFTQHLERESGNENRNEKKQLKEDLVEKKINDEDIKLRIKRISTDMEFNKKEQEIEREEERKKERKEDVEKKQRRKTEKREKENKKQLQNKKENREKEKVQEKEIKNSKYDFPYMEERIENQREVLKYPKKVYLQAVVVLLLGLFALFILMKGGILSVNGKPDSIRCIIAILCYIFLLFGAFLIIFRKENQCAEIEENVDYIDWEEDYDSLPMPEIYGLTVSEPIEENYYQNAFLKETGNSSFKRKKRENDDKRMEEDKGNEEDEEENTETELLVDFSDHSVAYLESEFSGERIYLKKFPFLIGKLKKGTDYVLENNKISRIHAKFDYDESHHYIEDMNSTNGTSLNGFALLAHDRKQLSNGDKICFADKNFIFHC